MNLDQILVMVQDFRSQLEVWGVTNNQLAIAAGVAALVLILSLREVACWFFRVYQVRDEVRSLRKQTQELRDAISDLRMALTAANVISLPIKPLNAQELLKKADFLRDMTAAPPPGAPDAATKFRLDH